MTKRKCPYCTFEIERNELDTRIDTLTMFEHYAKVHPDMWN